MTPRRLATAALAAGILAMPGLTAVARDAAERSAPPVRLAETPEVASAGRNTPARATANPLLRVIVFDEDAATEPRLRRR